jgi:glucose-6-phosphate isomerase
MIQFDKAYDFKADEALMQSAMAQVREEMQSGRIGYYTLPQTSIAHLERLKAERLYEGVEQIVIIGIGGSSLGIKAIDALLRPLTPTAKEILYMENSDPLTILATLAKIEKQKAAFFVISKSGSTIETTSIFKTVIAHFNLDLDGADRSRVSVITDEGSVLSDFARHHGLPEYTIPDNVGGRFSVLSAVGVVPLQVAGYDMSGVLDGAGEMLARFFGDEMPELLEKACFYSQNASSMPINVLFSYADSFEALTKWYVQLWGESLGKIDLDGERVGLTPVGIIGAIDQHSFLQLVIEGPRNKSMTFLKVADFGSDLSIPNLSLKHIEKTDFINSQRFSTLINAQCDATQQSVMESGVPSDTMTLDKVTPENIGALVIYFELLTSLVGAMLRINTYDQPGVELGKTILYKKLS